MITHLEWDSAHFGFPIGMVQGPLPEVSAEHHCLYFLAPESDLAAHQQALLCGFVNRGERVTLAVSDWERHDLPPLRKAVPSDLDALAAIDFPDSRFSQDPRFSCERVRAMYLAWMQRLLDSTYVATTGDSVMAYVSCAEESGKARICLFAIAEPFRGGGIGRQLVDQAKWWAAERGLRQLTVVTQGSNQAGLRLYQRNGFHIVRREVWFHWWRP